MGGACLRGGGVYLGGPACTRSDNGTLINCSFFSRADRSAKLLERRDKTFQVGGLMVPPPRREEIDFLMGVAAVVAEAHC